MNVQFDKHRYTCIGAILIVVANSTFNIRVNRWPFIPTVQVLVFQSNTFNRWVSLNHGFFFSSNSY